jgi:hypothetical protein
MFIEYNNLYINVSATGVATRNGERCTLHGLDGEAILDLAGAEWRRAVEGAMPTLPAAPGFTLLTFQVGEDGDVRARGEYPIVGWRPNGDGTAEPVRSSSRRESESRAGVADRPARCLRAAILHGTQHSANLTKPRPCA